MKSATDEGVSRRKPPLGARLIVWIVFCIAVVTYVAFSIPAMLRGELIAARPPTGWQQFTDAVLAFPAFWLGAAPLTGLILNALFWGAVAATIAAAALFSSRGRKFNK